jgi:uncharacterized protein YbjT (DUF2867 family)
VRIVIAGATGLVGRQLVEELAAIDKVELHMLVRRDAGFPPLNCKVHLSPPDNWPLLVHDIQPEIAISCLGTTWKKAGKSKSAFRSVDFDLVTNFAKAAREAGARHMISISSVAANPQSHNFYLRTKGEAEAALKALDFQRLDIVKPGLLTGQRQNDRRFAEDLGIMLSPLTDMLLQGNLRCYRSISSVKVAQAIATLALSGGSGRYIHTNEALHALAG